MALEGFDISNRQGAGGYALAASGAFVICKATEGLTFDDKYHHSYVKRARAAGKLVGHYHYAHPGNAVIAEADHFIDFAAPLPGEVMALDFEPYGQTAPEAGWPEWALAFLGRVRQRTGASCWLYVNGDMGGRLWAAANATQRKALTTYPLWKAAYASTEGTHWDWAALTAWQYTDKPLDKDRFYGTAATWRLLGAQGKDTTVALTEDDLKKIVAHVWNADRIRAPFDTGNPKYQTDTALSRAMLWARDAKTKAAQATAAANGARSDIDAVDAKVDALLKAVADARDAAVANSAALAQVLSLVESNVGLTPEQIQDAVVAGLKEVIKESNVTLLVDNPGTPTG